MITLWEKLSDTYKILLSMLLLIMLIQLITLLYIWKFESKILLKKERKNLTYQLGINSKLLTSHMHHLEKELEFLSKLEVMDDILVNDVDKRITVLLEKKTKDLSQNIILEALNNHSPVASSKQAYNSKDFLEFKITVYASFDRKKRIGFLRLLF